MSDEQSPKEQLDLSCEEENSLRYAAGYVCRAMKNKLGTNDSNMMECINDLIDDEEASLDPSTEWTKLASHGWLLHIKDTTYDVFHAIELVVRQFFTKGYISQLISGGIDEIIERIKMDEDVQLFLVFGCS